jgi:hypothetical protein
MRLSIPILFLTLVVSGLSANAAPAIDREPSPIQMSPKDKSEPIYSLAKPELNWSLRLGLLTGVLKEPKLVEQLYFYGLRYDFRREALNTWQIEVDGAKDNFIHIVLGKKLYFPLGQDRMPYYKISVGDLINSTDGLGAVFNLKKFQAMAAIGFDDILEWNRHLEGEIGVSYALIGPQLEVSFGFGF